MGVYLNPGNVDFQEVLNSKIYVDKSVYKQRFTDYTKIYLRQPSTSIRKVYGSEYADGLLQPWL